MAEKKTPDNVSSREAVAWDIFRKDSQNPEKIVPPRDDERAHSEKEPHIDAQFKVKGNIVKGVFYYAFDKAPPLNASYYAWNAWNYLGAGGAPQERDIYKSSKVSCYHFYNAKYKPNFYQKFLKNKIDIDKINSHLSGLRSGDAKIYLKRAKQLASDESQPIGQYMPYQWQAHHLLPMNCFLAVFSQADITIIRRSIYDINRGENIIFLPVLDEDTSYHDLPYHSSNHHKYNQRVKDQFGEIKKTMSRMQNKPHDAIAIKIEQELKKFEKKNFKYVANYGQKRLV